MSKIRWVVFVVFGAAIGTHGFHIGTEIMASFARQTFEPAILRWLSLAIASTAFIWLAIRPVYNEQTCRLAIISLFGVVLLAGLTIGLMAHSPATPVGLWMLPVAIVILATVTNLITIADSIITQPLRYALHLTSFLTGFVAVGASLVFIQMGHTAPEGLMAVVAIISSVTAMWPTIDEV